MIGNGRRVRGRRKNGEIFPMRLAVTEVRRNGEHHFIGLLRDLTEEDAARERIEFLALHDALTGLPNRAQFKEVLGTACAASRVQTCAVLFIDLDGFKPINDQYGHEAGDEALITVAKRLRHSLAEEDMVARYGGDEFVVMLSGPENVEQASTVARRLLDAISGPMTLLGKNCRLGASIGIALMPARCAAEDVLKTADQAMYAAKRAGRGGFAVAGNAGEVRSNKLQMSDCRNEGA